nr:hypothetical protein [Liquorilactobacillus satsumensis]
MGKNFLNIFKIHSERYAELIKQAEFDDEAVINAHTTLLVMDCQSFPELNCKSFLLDQYRGIIKTNKETRKLINQFVAQRPLSFWGDANLFCLHCSSRGTILCFWQHNLNTFDRRHPAFDALADAQQSQEQLVQP